MTVTAQTTVQADLSDRFGSRIAVYFSYNRDDVRSVKTVPGATFVGKDRIGPDEEPYWIVPKDMMSARALRDAFGDRLELTQRLAEWGWQQSRKDKMLGSLASATDADLDNLPLVLPKVVDVLRPYQRAGVKFLSHHGGLIADQPGLGKTIQTIGALAEAELFDDEEGGKAFLVVAPATSLTPTWKKELEKWQGFEAFVCTGSRNERKTIISDFMEHLEFGGNGWLVVNPAMVRYRREYDTERCIEHDDKSASSEKKKCAYCVDLEVREYGEFDEIVWDAIVVDESHEVVRNPTLTSKGVKGLKEGEGCKKIAMTGTPIYNLPMDLWAVLNWMNPDTFSSKWRWAERFCEINDNGYGKTIGDLREDMQEEFFESLKPYVLRRTKKEVAPELPEKIRIPVELPFASKEHEKQYRQFENEAFIKIADLELGATGVLDELTRLRQFATALCTVTENPKGDGHPVVVRQTNESAKVDWLDELLREMGILDDKGKATSTTQDRIVVFSQFVSVLDMLKKHYEAKGVTVGEVSGRVGSKGRDEAIAKFQDKNQDMSIMLVSTKAGGVSIELDAANDVVFMDETWTAAAMEQAEDRLHRVNKGRTVPVTVYTLRTKGTVETEVVKPKVEGKKAMSDFILDVRRGVMSS